MIVDGPNDRVFLKLGDMNIVRAVLHALPDAAERVQYKQHNVMVDLTLKSARVLRDIGIRVPSPIRHQYHWPGKYKPLDHQIETSEFITLNRRGFVLNQMGTMKTASALWAADYLMEQKVVGRTLVVAPLSTLERVWRDEVFNFVMHRTAVILHGSAERRMELLASGADFYIINYEGLAILWKQIRKRKDINLVIVDEAAAYRNSRSDRYDVLQRMLRPEVRVILMTGTPCPNAPTDAWALSKLVDPTKTPTYFTAYRRQVMQQVSTYKWKPRVGSNKMAFEAMQPAIRFRKKDCLSLPPVTYEQREVPLSSEQVKAYTAMKRYLIAQAAGEEISAINAADKLGKLRQILCGAVRHPKTGEYVILKHRPRLNVLLECIEQASAKVLVIVPFKGITRVLHDEVEEHFTCEVVNGDVSIRARNDIFHRFKHDKSPRVLLCHPKVMAHGLTLVEADMMIFYAPIYSNEQSQQVVERIDRPGQTLPMTIVQMGASKLEWDIYDQVEGNRLTQESILELYKRELQ